MASNLYDPGEWRLASPGGSVPFKFLGLDGSFEATKGSVSYKGLIPSDRLVDFLVETFPPPITVGKVSVPQSVPLPGLPGLICTKVAFKNQDDGRPVDPFGFDPDAPAGTYHPAVEVNMEFGPRDISDPKPDDPRTFLEISSNTSGEFINSTAPRAKWQAETRNASDIADDEDPGSVTDPEVEEEVEDPAGKPTTKGEKTPVKDPTIPMMVLVPHTEWTVKWKQIPYYYFYNVMVRRLRWCLGRVNANNMPLIFGAIPETILFLGYNYSESRTWKDGEVNTPPVDVEMKFLEKRVVWNNIVIGHNHFWRPGVGWQRLLIDGTNPTYLSRNHNVIWDV
jgi:hypothetical protein